MKKVVVLFFQLAWDGFLSADLNLIPRRSEKSTREKNKSVGDGASTPQKSGITVKRRLLRYEVHNFVLIFLFYNVLVKIQRAEAHHGRVLLFGNVERHSDTLVNRACGQDV